MEKELKSLRKGDKIILKEGNDITVGKRKEVVVSERENGRVVLTIKVGGPGDPIQRYTGPLSKLSGQVEKIKKKRN